MNMRKQQGISLVELMISITIGLILMTGVVQLFLSSRATFSTQQALSRVQETGRLAMEFLADEIRMAGYMGCMSRNMNFTSTLKDQSSFEFSFGDGIEGLDDFDGTVPTGYPAGFTALAGTDVLVVRGASGSGVGVTRNNESGQLFVVNTGEPASCDTGEKSFSGLCENDILVVSDCSKARVFQATSMQDVSAGGVEVNIAHAGTGTPGNDPTSWGGASDKDPNANFGPDSEIIKVNASAYYIDTGTSGRPSLWRKMNDSTPQELLEGVQDMQLLYGRDTSGDSIPDAYEEADVITAANAWEDVSSVRVQLLVQSTDDNVLEDAQPYTFNGTTNSTPGDRRLRQVFINTVGIRSRLP